MRCLPSSLGNDLDPAQALSPWFEVHASWTLHSHFPCSYFFLFVQLQAPMLSRRWLAPFMSPRISLNTRNKILDHF